MDQRQMGVSVFFPAYNDEKTITSLVSKALEILPTVCDDYEVLMVNDGSTDATGSIADRLAATLPGVRAIHHETNRGYGAALRTGFSEASKELIFYTDGDEQYDVREMVSLFPLMTDGIDVVNGYKIRRSDPLQRKVFGGIYNQLAHLLFRIPIRDVDCDFRLIRRRALQRVELVSNSGAICVEMIHKLTGAGCKFAEVPVNHYKRAHGESQFFTPEHVARAAIGFFILWVKLVAARYFSFGTPDAEGAALDPPAPEETPQTKLAAQAKRAAGRDR